MDFLDLDVCVPLEMIGIVNEEVRSKPQGAESVQLADKVNQSKCVLYPVNVQQTLAL